MKSAGIVILSIVLSALSAVSQPASPLTLKRTIELPGITGKFDHFAIDLEGNRLFAAATGNHSVEVVNLKTGTVEQSIAGLGKPHGLVWIPATDSLYVADGSLKELRMYRGRPLKLAASLKLSDDADDMVFNPSAGLLYVGHGGTDTANPPQIAVVADSELTLKASLPVSSHPEALDLDPATQRVFANIAGAGEIDVIDTANNSITAHWKLKSATDNVPIAVDPEHRLVYIACRKPAVLIALDAASGAELAQLPIGAGADDLFYDPGLKRVYVIAGAGEVDAYQVDAQKTMRAIGILRTEAGAKTALFVPAQSLLYLGVPAGTGESAHPAEIRVYAVQAK
jgi:DNA-binding beta-propeller fold protein YncE